MSLDISVAFSLEIAPALMHGALVTFAATISGFVMALFVGAGLLGMARSPYRLLVTLGSWVMEVLRATPLLIQVYFLFFVLPDYGLVLEPIATGVIALGLYHGAYVAEAYRAALSSIPRGQWDATASLRLSRRTIWARIVLPQALTPLLPALGNTFITMLKDTPILAAVTIPELMFVANEVGSQSFRYVEPITIAALAYLLMSGIAAGGVHLVQRWLKGRYK